MFADFKILWKLILLSQIFEILSIYKPSLGLGGYVSFLKNLGPDQFSSF